MGKLKPASSVNRIIVFSLVGRPGEPVIDAKKEIDRQAEHGGDTKAENDKVFHRGQVMGFIYSVSRYHAGHSGSVATLREDGAGAVREFKLIDGVLVSNDASELTVAEWCGSATVFVAQLWDQSGSGNHATQTNPVKQPRLLEGAINGKAAIKFDGSNDWLDLPDSALSLPGLTVIASVQPTATTGTLRYIDSASSRLVLGQDTNYFHFRIGSHGGWKVWPATKFAHVMSMRCKDDQSIQGLLNNANQGTGTSTATGAVTGLCFGAYNQGASNFFDGYLVELAAWDSSLADADYTNEIRSFEAHCGAHEIVATVIESGTGHGDATDAADITGNGLKDVAWVAEDGIAVWYEQTSLGVFDKHFIRNTNIGGEVEGCLWVDVDDDGQVELVVPDQGLGTIRIYKQATSDPRGTWTEGTIQTGRPNLQMAKAVDLDDDDQPEIVYTWEGTNGTTGGIHALKYNGGDVLSASSYTDHQLVQHPGAWWIADDLRDMAGNGRLDMAFTARAPAADRNLANLPGLYWAERPASNPLGLWTKHTIHTTADDWMHCDFGDFCGNGASNDILTHDLLKNIRIFSAAGGWASPKSPAIALMEGGGGQLWNACRLGYKTNGRDAILHINSQRMVLWQFDGSNYVMVTRLVGSTLKSDSRLNRFDVNGDGSEDVLACDSVGDKVLWWSVAFGVAPPPPPPPETLTWDEFKAAVEGQGVTGTTVIDSIALDGDHEPVVTLSPAAVIADGGSL